MKVLVSGGAGFIGSFVVEELLRHQYEVIVIDNLSTGFPKNLKEAVSIYQIDINDSKLEAVFKKEKPDFVIHLAAQASISVSMQDPFQDFLTNTAGTLKLLLLSKKYSVKNFLFSSTAAVYGEPLYQPIDETHKVEPQSYYAQSKLSAENYISLYSDLHGLNSCILRFSNVYGPRQNVSGEAGVVSIFINKLLNDEKVSIYGGQQTRDFIYVKDVARSCRLALESEKSGIFNVSSSSETTIEQLFFTITNLLGIHSEPLYEQLRKGEVIRSVLDNRKALKEFHWSIKYSLLDGIRETTNYYSDLFILKK